MKEDERPKDRPNVITKYRTQSGRSVIDKFIEKQPGNAVEYFDFKIGLLEERGLDLGPHHVKRVRGKLWELKVLDAENREYRVFFFVSPPNEIVLVHAIVKRTQQLPNQDVELALRRMNEMQYARRRAKRV